MFRRLFISLLILSALSTEGVVNFSANFYKMYLTEVSKLNTSIDNEHKALGHLQGDMNYQLLLESFLSNTRDRLFLLSRNTSAMFISYKPVEQKYIHSRCIEESLHLPATKENLTRYYGIAHSNKLTNKDFIISKSDSSPPYISL